MSATLPRFADFWSMRYSAGGHLLTRLFSQRIGAIFAWAGGNAGLSPNAITLLGTAVFLAAATLFAWLPGGGAPSVVCLLLFQLGYGLDCADGQLARATGRTSPFGAWLDVACDYLRNVLLGTAISAWLLRNGLPLPAAMLAGSVFAAGAASQLHTVTVLRQTAPDERLQTRGAASRLRVAVTGVLDTATVLLVLPLLRGWPNLLALFAGSVGLLYLLMACYLARQRLRPG